MGYRKYKSMEFFSPIEEEFSSYFKNRIIKRYSSIIFVQYIPDEDTGFLLKFKVNLGPRVLPESGDNGGSIVGDNDLNIFD